MSPDCIAGASEFVSDLVPGCPVIVHCPDNVILFWRVGRMFHYAVILRVRYMERSFPHMRWRIRCFWQFLPFWLCCCRFHLWFGYFSHPHIFRLRSIWCVVKCWRETASFRFPDPNISRNVLLSSACRTLAGMRFSHCFILAKTNGASPCLRCRKIFCFALFATVPCRVGSWRKNRSAVYALYRL